MLSLTAKDIMTRNVVTIRKGSSIAEALKAMADYKVSGLPVVDVDDRLVGIITESDVLLMGQGMVSEGDNVNLNSLFRPRAEGLEEAYRRARASLVEEAMTRKVLVFSEDSMVVDIARAMMEHAINRVPILRDQKVVGIVSRRDVIKALAKAANGEATSTSDGGRYGTIIEL